MLIWLKNDEILPKYLIGRLEFQITQSALIGDQILIKAFADKLLRSGGYSTIEVEVDGRKIASTYIVYSVIRQGKK